MIIIAIFFVIGLYILFSIRIMRPTERAAVETLGKYSHFAHPGFNIVWRGFQRLIRVPVTESMNEVEPQEIITEDNLNARVDLVVYYKVKDDEESIKRAIYSVNDVVSQLDTLARTTARNVIGGMKFSDVNSKRKELNDKIAEILRVETEKWGVDVVRVELKEIIPPKEVQMTMNSVIQAENQKRAALDIATATETQADGQRRAAIQMAEGKKQAAILEAEGQAKAFDLINKSFTGNAQLLRQLEVTENSLKANAKIIITKDGINPQLVIGALPVKSE